MCALESFFWGGWNSLWPLSLERPLSAFLCFWGNSFYQESSSWIIATYHHLSRLITTCHDCPCRRDRGIDYGVDCCVDSRMCHELQTGSQTRRRRLREVVGGEASLHHASIFHRYHTISRIKETMVMRHHQDRAPPLGRCLSKTAHDV